MQDKFNWYPVIYLPTQELLLVLSNGFPTETKKKHGYTVHESLIQFQSVYF